MRIDTLSQIQHYHKCTVYLISRNINKNKKTRMCQEVMQHNYNLKMVTGMPSILYNTCVIHHVHCNSQVKRGLKKSPCFDRTMHRNSLSLLILTHYNVQMTSQKQNETCRTCYNQTLLCHHKYFKNNILQHTFNTSTDHRAMQIKCMTRQNKVLSLKVQIA